VDSIIEQARSAKRWCKNLGAPEGQSQQLLQIFQLPCGITIAKSLSALARQSK
jgi:hypothetical protein